MGLAIRRRRLDAREPPAASSAAGPTGAFRPRPRSRCSCSCHGSSLRCSWVRYSGAHRSRRRPSTSCSARRDLPHHRATGSSRSMRWAVWQRTVRSSSSTVVGLFVRSFPLLLLFVSFLFLTNEVWQVSRVARRSLRTGSCCWRSRSMGTLFAVAASSDGSRARLADDSVVRGRLRGACAGDACGRSCSPTSTRSDVSGPGTSARRSASGATSGSVVLFSQGLQVAPRRS